MTARRRLAITVAVTGLALGLAALALRYGIERVLVERAGRASHHGFEVVVTTPFPAPGEELELAITDKVYEPGRFPVLPGAILRVDVRADDERVEQLSFSPGKHVLVTVRPPEVSPGKLPLRVEIEYVRHGGHPMAEIRAATHVDVDARIYSASDRFWAQLRVAGQSWGLFLIWWFIVVMVARRYRTAETTEPAPVDLIGLVGLVIGLAGAAAIGDVVFGRPFLLSLGHTGFDTRVAMVVLWLGLPLMWLWIQAHRRPAVEPWLPDARVRRRTR